MSTQHTPTPGPWTVDGAGTRAIVRGADLTIVAVRHRLAGEIHEANCHRIAAAPDMYEALKAIVEDHDFCGDDWGDRRDAWIETARTAIAKAEGKS